MGSAATELALLLTSGVFLYALVRGAGGGPPTPRPEWLVLD